MNTATIAATIIKSKSIAGAACSLAAQIRKMNPEISRSASMKSAWVLIKTRKPARVVKACKGFTPSDERTIAKRIVEQMKAQAEVVYSQRLISAEEYRASKAA